MFKSSQQLEKERLDHEINRSLADLENRFNKDMEKFKFENSSQDTIKPIIMVDNIPSSSNSTLDRPIEAQITGLQEIRSDNFYSSSKSVLREMDHFFKLTENNIQEKLAITAGLYKVLRSRLYKLSESNPQQYDKLTNNPLINNKIEKFIDLENKYYTPEEIIDANNYNELEQSAVQEAEV
jgi:hypothetical protein